MYSIGITGSTGFVGTNLIDYLASPTLVINPIDRNQLNSIESYQITNNAIIHLAGKAHDLKKSSNPKEYYEVNYELTKKLFDAFIKSDAEKFIFISSVKAATDIVNGILVEDSSPNPKTHYGKSKLMAEQYIQSQVLPEGKSFFILRPCMIHGPGNKGNLNLLYKFVQKGIPYPLAAFENSRSFLSVQNLSFVIANLLRKDIPCGIYQVADDESLSTNEIVSILAASLGNKPKLWKIPTFFINALAKIGDALKLPLNTDRLTKLTESYVVSNKKIKSALGVELPLTCRSGLEKTAESFM